MDQPRDLRMARRWVRDEPESLLALKAIAIEEFARGDGYRRSLPYLLKYVEEWERRHGFRPEGTDRLLHMLEHAPAGDEAAMRDLKTYAEEQGVPLSSALERLIGFLVCVLCPSPAQR